MAARKPFLLRLDPALYSALEAWAQQELRSVNGQIEYLLKKAVLARDRRALPQDIESRDDRASGDAAR
ncbi:MAG: ribbon-helix-helix domain-containing protein [Planctomycetaceae bacterium]